MSKWRTIGTINGDTPCEVKTSTAHIMKVQRMRPVAYEDLQESEEHGTNTDLEFSKEIYDEELSKQLRKRMKKK